MWFIGFLAFVQVASAQFGAGKAVNENPLTVEVLGFSEPAVAPSEIKEFKLKLTLDDEFHAYLDQYRLELAPGELGHVSEFQVQPVIKFTDPITKKSKHGTKGISEMAALYTAPAKLPADKKSIALRLTYQACGKDFCLFPKTIDLNLPIQNVSAPPDQLTAALSKGLLQALLVVLLAGLATAFTPCIYPMIPITLAVIGSRDLSKSRSRGFTMSFIYVNGIAVTYSILGIIAAETGSLFGSLLGHPIAVMIIAGLFILMGLSMYGLFEIQMPQAIVNKIGHTRLEKNAVGAFGSGLIAGLIASPCVGPMLIGILTYVAKTQDHTLGFGLLYTFAIGLGIPFMVLGTFQGLLHHIPRSGPWMDKVKFIFGTLMIAMAIYVLKPITMGPLFDGLVATTLILIGYFFGAFKKRQEAHEPKWERAFFRVVFVAGLVLGAKAFIPPGFLGAESESGNGTETTANFARPDWANYSEDLMAQAKASGRPVILDIKAEWCKACHELERYTFSDPSVLAKGKEFLWLSFDATKPSEEFDKLQKRFQIGGLPFVAFFDATGEYRQDLTLFGFEKADQFLQRMQSASPDKK